ncbi:polymorphic toxin type 30 domain-containing protein [Actinocrispum wychmicini]|uniref:RHS repeat-associated protein n=1 Tax=Actinocrispum wychmicini TaxID=1213861 RepID=A0A4R2J9I1_9PSEU|nr:polymorphic toxin type 30 domain-containing protein [Actinocrispum wychmicini]TCO55973.1 RHS repeat-associated protein [Actinocrispum wychmicini]
MRRRFAAVFMCLSVLGAVVVPMPAVAVAAVADRQGHDGAGGRSKPSPAAHRQVPPQVAEPAKPSPPPAGSPARATYDKFVADSAAVTDRIRARAKQTTVKPEPAAAGMTAPRQAKAASDVDPCAPVGGEQWFATYSGGGIITTPTNNSPGVARVSVVNRGSQTWPAGHTSLGYHLFDSAGVEVPGDYPRTPLSGAVANGGSATVDATIAALAPATWQIKWDLWVDGPGWFSHNAVCTYAILYTIRNQAPNLTLLSPPNHGTVKERTPRLFVSGVDPDAWPGVWLTYQFIVCRDAALTAGCVVSDWQTSDGYPVPVNVLGWNDTFYWSARVSDSKITTPDAGWAPPNEVRVVVPVPDKWRTVGTGLGLTNVGGMVLPYGTWVHTETDADVAGVGVPLTVQRTYSSEAAQVPGAFGRGWLSMFDASAQYSPDNQLLTVTYPDGRQEIFARQSGGGWVTRADTGSTDRLSVAGDGVITVRGADQQVLTFGPAGELRTVETTGVGALALARNTAGQVTTVTQQPSGRSLTVGWVTTNAGCSQPAPPPRVAEIVAGTAHWTYSYGCDGDLAKVCDPVNACATYGTEWADRAGRRVVRPYPDGDNNWEPNGAASKSYRIWGNDRSTLITVKVFTPRENAGTDYLANYNSFGGATVHVVVDAEGEEGGIRQETYRFDEVNRLRDLSHGGIADAATAPHRSWDYGVVTGRLEGFVDENLNVKELRTDAWGNLTGNILFRDPNTQVTHNATYFPDVNGDPDKTRMRGIVMTPREGNDSQQGDMFGYDTAGRLTQRRGHPVPETPGGPLTTFTYTTGGDAAAGPRRGGTSPPGGDKMPAGLPRTTVRNWATTTFSYNGNGDVTEVVDPVGRKTAYDYDVLGRRVSATEYTTTYPAGVQTRFVLDAAGRAVEEIRPATTNAVTGAAQQLRICREYDGSGLVTKTVETPVACPAVGAARRAGDRTTETTYDSNGRPAKVVDADGGTTTYSYLRARRTASATQDSGVVRVTDPHGTVTEQWYDAGRLMEERRTNGAGAVITTALYAYDQGGRRVQESDALGRKTTYFWTGDDLVYRAPRAQYGSTGEIELFNREFDGDGRITSELTGGSRLVRNHHDGEGKLVDTVLDPAGLNRTDHRDYNQLGQLVTETVTGGGRTERTDYCRAATGALTCTVRTLGNEKLETHFQVDQRGLTTSAVDPRGVTPNQPDDPDYTAYTKYDELGRATSSTGHRAAVEPGGPARPTVTYGYDAFGQLTHVKDAKGDVTTTGYDDAGHAVETRYPAYTPPGSSTPLVPTTTRSYDAAGLLLRETDARGKVTDYVYDAAGRQTEVRAPVLDNGLRPVTKYEYDAAGQRTATVGPTGARVEYWYDSVGRVVTRTEVVRQTSSGTNYLHTNYTYDGVGDLTRIETPMGLVVRMDYNAGGEVTKVWLPGATKPISYDHDLAGRVTKQTDRAGRAVETEYDQAGRAVLSRQRAADGTELAVARSEYDRAGNVTAVVAPNSARTTFQVDALDRVVSTTQQVSAGQSITTRSTGYDIAGNPVRVTDGRGNTTTYEYNTLGKVASVTEPATAAHPALADRRWTTTYDAGGLPVTLAEPGGVTIDRGYDAAGRLRQEDGRGAGAPVRRTWTYDLAGRIGSITHPDQTRTFAYSDRGLVLTTNGPDATIATFDYDADGHMTSRQDPAGVSNFYWRPDGQLGEATDPLTGLRRTYQYYANSGELNQISWPNGLRRSFGYDQRGRVNLIASTNAAGTVTHDVRYGYDSNGNVTSEIVANDPAASSTYAYDLGNRLTRWAPGGGAPAHDYTSDNAGNRVAEQTATGTDPPVQTGSWTYDERDRLTTAHTNQDVSYQYTPRGTLATTTVAGGATSTSTFDAFDQMVADAGVTYRYDALGRLAERNGDRFEYDGLERDPVVAPGETYARGLSGDLVAAQINGSSLIPLTNGHGDTVGWTPSKQTASAPAPLAGRTKYDPFGARIAATGTQSALGFQSDWTDTATGRVDMDARWYQPSTGGFTARDSVDSGNRYGYGAANPVTNTDPTGHWAETPAVCGSISLQATIGLGAAGPVGGLVGGAAGVGGCVGSVLGPAGAVAGELLGGGVAILGTVVLGGLASLLLPKPTGVVHNGIRYDQWDARSRDYFQVGCVQGRGCGQTLWCGCAEPLPQMETVPVPDPAPAPGPRTPPVAPTPPPPPPPPPVLIHDTTLHQVKAWSQSTSWASGTYRFVRQDDYTQDWARRTKVWSDGFWSDTGWYLNSWHDDWRVSWVNTLDPNRIDGIVADAGVIANSGLLSGVTAGTDAIGQCGLNGTILSCLGEALSPVVGAGCAGVLATMLACNPTEPGPGRPEGQHEAARSQIQLTNTCHTGGWNRFDGTRALMAWTCGDDIPALRPLAPGRGYDLRGIDPMSIVPDDASVRGLKPDPNGGAQYGIEFAWRNADGTRVRLRIHGPDGTAPPGSNSASGETYRVQIGARYQDISGTLYPRNVHNPLSPYYDPVAANAAHIPWPFQFPGL